MSAKNGEVQNGLSSDSTFYFSSVARKTHPKEKKEQKFVEYYVFVKDSIVLFFFQLIEKSRKKRFISTII